MIEKFVQLVAIVCTALFALLTGSALAQMQYEQAVRFGAAAIGLLIIAIIGVFTGCTDDSATQDNPLQGRSPQDRS